MSEEEARKAAVEMPKGWDGEPVIKFPVHYRSGFVIDADEQIVCNLLWNSHRKNYDVRDQAGQYVASSLNAHADHTAALREKALALVAALPPVCGECFHTRLYHVHEDLEKATYCSDCDCEGFRELKELTALKAALEGNDG